mgnify:FL=1
MKNKISTENKYIDCILYVYREQPPKDSPEHEDVTSFEAGSEEVENHVSDFENNTSISENDCSKASVAQNLDCDEYPNDTNVVKIEVGGNTEKQNYDSDTDGTVDLDISNIKRKGKRKKKEKSENESPKRQKKEKSRSEPKEPKPKKPKPAKKIVEEAPPKPWINVKLDDHADKYVIERVESFERKNRGTVVFEDMYSCLICGQFKTIGKEIFEDHIEQHVNKVFECSKCNYISFSNADILKHKQQCLDEKKEGREYMCHLCGCKLFSKGEKVSHMGGAHHIAELPCKYCDELFTTKHLRKKHYRTVHTEECQFCPSCNEGLSNLTKEEYLKHVKDCVPGHQCQMCGKLFLRKQGLDHHVTYTHLKVRKFKCNLCAYTATTPDKLKLHVLAHNGKFKVILYSYLILKKMNERIIDS